MRLIKGYKYHCKCINILSYGAVMEMADGSTELLHISNASDAFVKDMHNVVTVGETYEVTAVPGKTKPLEITLRETDIVPDEEEDFDNMSFDQLLDMYPPTPGDLRNKKIRFKSKKGR